MKLLIGVTCIRRSIPGNSLASANHWDGLITEIPKPKLSVQRGRVLQEMNLDEEE